MTYDRPYKIPVILEFPNLKEEERVILLESLKDFRPQELTYPSHYALEVCKTMAERGWPSLARPLPLQVSSAEAVQVFAQCLKMFNDNVYVRRTPDASAVNKKIQTTADFGRMVDELTAQQDDISLSQIFQTDKARSDVFWTDKGNGVNAKLSDNVIRVSRLGETDKDVDKRLKSLQKQIQNCIENSRELDKVTFKEQGTSAFRYK